MIKGGGARVNNVKVEAEDAIIAEEDVIEGRVILIAAGKKNNSSCASREKTSGRAIESKSLASRDEQTTASGVVPSRRSPQLRDGESRSHVAHHLFLAHLAFLALEGGLESLLRGAGVLVPASPPPSSRASPPPTRPFVECSIATPHILHIVVLPAGALPSVVILDVRVALVVRLRHGREVAAVSDDPAARPRRDCT